MVARENENIYLGVETRREEDSYSLIPFVKQVERIVSQIGAERYVSGTFFIGGLHDPVEYDVYVRYLKLIQEANLAERQRELIMGETISTLLKI